MGVSPTDSLYIVTLLSLILRATHLLSAFHILFADNYASLFSETTKKHELQERNKTLNTR